MLGVWMRTLFTMRGFGALVRKFADLWPFQWVVKTAVGPATDCTLFMNKVPFGEYVSEPTNLIQHSYDISPLNIQMMW